MDITRINRTLTQAIQQLQEDELDELHEKAKSPKKKKRGKKGILKKVIGRSPDKGNPLDRGSGIKGFFGRMEPM